MKGLPLLTATTPISASVEDAAAIQVHYIIIAINFVSLNYDRTVFLYLVYSDKNTHLNIRGASAHCHTCSIVAADTLHHSNQFTSHS